MAAESSGSSFLLILAHQLRSGCYFWLFSDSTIPNFGDFPRKSLRNGAAKTLGPRGVKTLNLARVKQNLELVSFQQLVSLYIQYLV